MERYCSIFLLNLGVKYVSDFVAVFSSIAKITEHSKWLYKQLSMLV